MATIKGSVEFDIKSFRDAMKQMRDELKLVESESTALSSSMLADGKNVDTLGKSLDGARKKVEAYGDANEKLCKLIDQLNDQITEQKKKITDTTTALKTAQNETGDESDEVKKLSKELTSLNKGLDQMENALNQSKRALNDNTTALNKAQNEVNQLDTEIKGLNVSPVTKLKNAFSDLNSTVNQSNSGFTVLKGTLSNLFSSAISWGVDKVKQGVTDLVTTGVNYQSDLAEVQNVVDQSFKDSSGTIDKWSKDLLGTFGMNELNAKKYASTMGAMLQSANPDLSSDEIAKYTTDVVERMADMASFYNYDLDEMFQKVQAGVAGEIEPLRRIGINMGATEIEAYAMAHGLETAWDELSEGEKQIYRINFLLERSAAAQGDYARTSEELANSMRTAGQTYEVIAGQMAEGINSILKTASNAFNEWYQNGGGAEKIEEWADKILDKFNELAGGLSEMDWNDMFDNIVDAIGELIIKLMEFAGWCIENKDAIWEFIKTALEIWAVVKAMQAFNTATQFFGGLGGVLKGLVEILGTSTGGTGLIRSLGLLGGKFALVYGAGVIWNGILSPLTSGLVDLCASIDDMGIPVISDLAGAFGWVIDKCQTLLDLLADIVTFNWGDVPKHFQELMQANSTIEAANNSAYTRVTPSLNSPTQQAIWGGTRSVTVTQNNYSNQNLDTTGIYRATKKLADKTTVILGTNPRF